MCIRKKIILAPWKFIDYVLWDMINGCRKCVAIDYACWCIIVNCTLMNCPRSL